LGRLGRALRADRRAVAAIEYAMVGIPFTVGLLFFVELAFDYYVQASVDFAVDAAARQIQRGEMPPSAQSQAAFNAGVLCPVLSGFLACSNIVTTLRTVSDWQTDPNLAPPISGGVLNPSGTTFCLGLPDQPMLLQVVFPTPTLVMRLFGRTVRYTGPNGATSTVVPIVGNAAFLYEPGTQYGTATCS
jgi:Flp pilus assembly protein TadG